MGKNSECSGQRQKLATVEVFHQILLCSVTSTLRTQPLQAHCLTSYGPDRNIVFAQQWSGTRPLDYSTQTKRNRSTSN